VRVLVVGSGAREHALVLALSGDTDVEHLVAAPGNPGIAELAEIRPVDLTDAAAIADLAVVVGADLVVIGPEGPLVAGAADAVRSRGIACFGPGVEAARLEGSKAFAKEVMAAAGVPTAMSFVCDTEAEVAAALDSFGPPYVVKDDALAAGKGVVVTDDRALALAHGSSCDRVVVEEFLDGPEVSIFVVTDGETVVPLMPAQDFKRLSDGDLGPNTGGMGAYAPLSWLPDGLVEDAVARVAQPTIDEMRARGTPFVGLLYIGLALTARGLRVVEFNARFGDPETQVVLPLLRSPLSSLLHDAAVGRLADHGALRWSRGAAVVVVLASEGYPVAPVAGRVITGLDGASSDDAYVLHAGTRVDAGRLETAGGRVLSVVGRGDDLAAARAGAYHLVDALAFDGMQVRRDIAATAAAPAPSA
jgi:phosphoribosylamine--glycine ligase